MQQLDLTAEFARIDPKGKWEVGVNGTFFFFQSSSSKVAESHLAGTVKHVRTFSYIYI